MVYPDSRLLFNWRLKNSQQHNHTLPEPDFFPAPHNYLSPDFSVPLRLSGENRKEAFALLSNTHNSKQLNIFRADD